MSRQSRNAGASAPSVTTRQNEYFVPRDGIDREVISADICRYLGNDALVRPGHYENPQTGQVVQGYYITAYRNLTTAMIEDLKADSARWDNERRAQTSRNTPGVQYRYSETHQSRQQYGPTDNVYPMDSQFSRDAPFDGPRYPGTGSQGYNGASGSFSQAPGYPPSGGGYGFQQQQQGQQSPPPASGYGSATTNSMMNPGYPAGQDVPYISTGANSSNRGYPPQSSDAYARSMSAAAPQQPLYATSAAPQPNYPYGSQVPTSASHPAMQPQDPFYGRASPAGQTTQSPQQGYAPQAQQYDETPIPRASTASSKAPTPAAGTSSRRSDRETDRHSTDRHHRTSRR